MVIITIIGYAKNNGIYFYFCNCNTLKKKKKKKKKKVINKYKLNKI